MKVKVIEGEFAEVETGRLTRKVNVQMLGGLKAGDYVIVHAGFAIQKIDARKAKETLDIIEELDPSHP